MKASEDVDLQDPRAYELQQLPSNCHLLAVRSKVIQSIEVSKSKHSKLCFREPGRREKISWRPELREASADQNLNLGL